MLKSFFFSLSLARAKRRKKDTEHEYRKGKFKSFFFLFPLLRKNIHIRVRFLLSSILPYGIYLVLPSISHIRARNANWKKIFVCFESHSHGDLLPHFFRSNFFLLFIYLLFYFFLFLMVQRSFAKNFKQNCHNHI